MLFLHLHVLLLGGRNLPLVLVKMKARCLPRVSSSRPCLLSMPHLCVSCTSIFHTLPLFVLPDTCGHSLSARVGFNEPSLNPFITSVTSAALRVSQTRCSPSSSPPEPARPLQPLLPPIPRNSCCGDRCWCCGLAPSRPAPCAFLYHFPAPGISPVGTL